MKRWRYGAGYINETKNGTYSAFVSLGHCKRRRAVLKTLAEAKAWILTGVQPNQLLIEDATRAREVLPKNVTLEEAALFWTLNHKNQEKCLLSEVWIRYAKQAKLSIRPKTFASYEQSKNLLIQSIGDIDVEMINYQLMESFLDGKTPTQRNNCISRLSPFFNYCVKSELINSNPCEKLNKAKQPRRVPSILSIDEVRYILSTAMRGCPKVASYFALGLFAGIRPAELLRIKSDAIQNGFIVLLPEQTKTGDSRNIPIQKNLEEWLKEYPIPNKGWSLMSIRRFKDAFNIHYPQDSLRHSYATYLYEKTKDAVFVASTMGHQGTDIFFRHYRALAKPFSGEGYFNITPQNLYNFGQNTNKM